MYLIKISKGGLVFKTLIIYHLDWFNFLFIRKDYTSKEFNKKEVHAILKLVINKLNEKYK